MTTEKEREARRLYQQKNRERIKASQHRWYIANRQTELERSRVYAQQHPERRKQIGREYRANNREKIRQIKRLYREKNREKEAERARLYRKANLEKCKDAARKKREQTADQIAHAQIDRKARDVTQFLTTELKGL